MSAFMCGASLALCLQACIQKDAFWALLLAACALGNGLMWALV